MDADFARHSQYTRVCWMENSPCTLRNTIAWHLCAGSLLPANCRTISPKHVSPNCRENRRKQHMQWAIVIAAFLASAVEFVEAFTLVLVARITSNWRSAIVGALAAVATLAVIVTTLGVALVTLIPWMSYAS